MMLGEPHRPNPTVHVPPWSLTVDDPTEEMFSNSPYYLSEALSALSQYEFEESEGLEASDTAAPVDAYSCDQFRMFEFKVRRCARGRSHDWTECPYAHPGEKARRRDPRRFHYSGAACPEFRKGHCKRGDACEFAHGVFECWLHPARYRTQPCKDGPACRRRVCFFAHTPDQLRVLPPQHSPRSAAESYDGAESPPASPPVSEVVAALRNLQLGKVKSLPSCWKGGGSPVFGSPRGSSLLRPGFCSLPATPTRAPARPTYLEFGDLEEEPAMERVESGRDIRARMLQKLRSENTVDRVDPNPGSATGPDVGWISELVM